MKKKVILFALCALTFFPRLSIAVNNGPEDNNGIRINGPKRLPKNTNKFDFEYNCALQTIEMTTPIDLTVMTEIIICRHGNLITSILLNNNIVSGSTITLPVGEIETGNYYDIYISCGSHTIYKGSHYIQ